MNGVRIDLSKMYVPTTYEKAIYRALIISILKFQFCQKLICAITTPTVVIATLSNGITIDYQSLPETIE